MSAYYSLNLTYTIYDCVSSADNDCHVTRDELASPPAAHVAAIHKALKMERQKLDKRDVMIPNKTAAAEESEARKEDSGERQTNIPQQENEERQAASSPTSTKKTKKPRPHFCHRSEDESDKMYLKRYNCGFNRINLCHFNGKEFTTMCVRVWSALFRNLDPADYCGKCRSNGDDEQHKGAAKKGHREIISTATR